MNKYFYLPIILLSAFLVYGSSNSVDNNLCEDSNGNSVGFDISDLEDTKYSLYCCKICKKGKACGDTCINKSYTCTKPRGCACNG